MAYVTDAAREYAKKINAAKRNYLSNAHDDTYHNILEYVFAAPTFDASAISSFILNNLLVDNIEEYDEYVNYAIDEIKNADKDIHDKRYRDYLAIRDKMINDVNAGLKQVASKNHLNKYAQIDKQLHKQYHIF